MSPETPRVITLEQAVLEARQIWLQFWRGGQTPEDAESRKLRLNTLLNTLPTKIEQELTTETSGKPLLAQVREATRLQVVGERDTASRIKKIRETSARRRNRR